MNVSFNEKQLAIVKQYDFDEPPINKVDSKIDNCFRDCHNKYFHTFEYKCVYIIKLIMFEVSDGNSFSQLFRKLKSTFNYLFNNMEHPNIT